MRYIVDTKNGDEFILNKETLEHIKVNRIRVNDSIHILYENEYYLCSFTGKTARIVQKTDINNEYNSNIVVAIPLIKYKKIDMLAQKLTELGVKEVYLINSNNVSVKFNDKDLEKKIQRWEVISKAACEQSFRNQWIKFPTLISFDEFIKLNFDNYNKYIAHEKVDPLDNVEKFEGDLVFMFGPEGGFSDLEISKAFNNNYKPISLGKRILRAETSILQMVSNIKLGN